MHSSTIPGRVSSGKTQWMIQEVLDVQASGKSVRCVVRSLNELDLLVSRGVKPSNICLTSELKPRCDWQNAAEGILDDVL